MSGTKRPLGWAVLDRGKEPLVTLTDVTLVYPGAPQPAISGLSLTIHQGEFIGVLGGNGSGKSSLAQVLAGLLLPTTGEVRWHVAEAMDGLSVGIVFQEPDDQVVGTTVAEDVAFGPSCLGLPVEAIWGRARLALAGAGLRVRPQRSPHRLSGGERQHLALADTLAISPKCLVLDEPTSMQDPHTARHFLGSVHRLHMERGMTVVHITHAVEEIWAADRVLVLDRGRLAFLGSPAELLAMGDILEDWGIAPPATAELVSALRQKGLPVGLAANAEELAEALWSLWPKN